MQGLVNTLPVSCQAVPTWRAPSPDGLVVAQDDDVHAVERDRVRTARDEPALAQPGQVFGGEGGFVRAEFDGSAPLWSPAGPDGGYAADERLEGEAVVHVRADTATASGMPWASDSTYSLLPFVPRSTGFGPVSDQPFGANGGRVDDRRGPVHLAPGPEFVQHRPERPPPQAGLGP